LIVVLGSSASASGLGAGALLTGDASGEGASCARSLIGPKRSNPHSTRKPSRHDGNIPGGIASEAGIL
jgi:hypothetical protein